MFVLPITGLSGIGFMAAGALFPLAGVVKLAAHFMGYEMKEIGIHIGSYSASAIEFLPLSILMGGYRFCPWMAVLETYPGDCSVYCARQRKSWIVYN